MNLSGYRIIFIHGRASKPPETTLFNSWKRCLIENVRAYNNPSLASDMEAQANDLFRMAYWANEIPYHIEDPPNKASLAIKNVIEVRKQLGDKFHVPGKKEKFKKFWKDAAADGVDILLRSLSLKDEVIEKSTHDVLMYSEDQYIADRIRLPLETQLRDAFAEGKKIALISHSMGTFIAYDVLWRFSHHRHFEAVKAHKIQVFVTMGSPLADSFIKDLMFGKQHGYKTREGLPTNIMHWNNFSTLGDIVCHDSDLVDDFKSMKKQKLLTSFKDYTGLYNPYRSGGKEKPHKSYGYLLQPKLARTMLRFFGKIPW
jgi:hypothetical protein